MGIFSVVLALLALAVLALLALASRKPDTFRVERRVTIRALPEVIFGKINTLRAWETWSPWQKKDPAMRQVYAGPDAGVGASQSWDGNKDVGKGSMTITGSTPPSQVSFRLDFEKPFKATNFADFTLTPVAGGTEVVWAMHGPANLFNKVFELLLNMDRMIGRDFEQGLQALKRRCEG